ncbi:MAG: aminopeptidase N [Hyphomicrobiales bacterium]
MRPETPQTIHLKDYKPVPYLIESVRLDFALDPQATAVASRLAMVPNAASPETNAALILHGEKIALRSAAIDGKPLLLSDYAVSDTALAIAAVPQRPFTLELVTVCNPSANTELSGLYMSNGMYCTQCEAEGFRRITYFYDRPDVMARYSVRIEAPKQPIPVLLSNGNPAEVGEIAGTERHFAMWNDPFPKPSYLFALVAGDLASVHDTFTTMSGRNVRLGIHVEKGKEDRCAWAMQSLKAAMRWDETAFGREYDLDVFNIVAVSAFNMGAMENKGLNVFNDKYILALAATATDADYVNIEAIIAHEYFHNWTGNRITCRDWFQLCLKEGLTVFRDQEFTSDVRSRAVKRITDVKTLRARQFPEDGGPLAHPVRPASYIEINNFYTPTVYEKGAELCRMMKTLIGETAFRKAMDLYFARHDGAAATVENFVQCMADASGRDFKQFFRWYEQAGTPQVIAEGHYDRAGQSYELTLEQITAPTQGQGDKLPLQIPLGLGLVGPDGGDMPLDLEGVGTLNVPLIELTEQKKTFRFRNVVERPVLSINRGFSAPVHMAANQSAAEQLFLMARDRDSFNRWEAGQMRGRALILEAMAGAPAGLDGFGDALGRILDDPGLDQAFKALMLGLPSEAEIAAALAKDVDASLVLAARDRIRGELGRALAPRLERIWQETREQGPYVADPAGTARRALRYAALPLMLLGDPAHGTELALSELENPHSMSTEIGALGALVQIETPAREKALAEFHLRHGEDHLITDKWFALNAQAVGAAAAGRIETLLRHPDFKLSVPNRVYALIVTFTTANQAGFNAADGAGYRIVADTVIALDPANPQVAARVATGFRSWRMFDGVRRAAAEAQLRRILAAPNLSRDCFEIVSRMVQ